MPISINKPIKDYEVIQPEHKKVEEHQQSSHVPPSNIVQMTEKLERPEILLGSTYKIKTPLTEHALYVTINDVVLNSGTEHEHRRPFEIFINSKNMEHFQWIVALTRIISAVFRKGGDITFLVEELKSVFDPRGGYFKKGGRYMPSLVAEIGACVEAHMVLIGLISNELDEHQQAYLEQKRQQIKAAQNVHNTPDSTYPDNATLCMKCHTKAVVTQAGCPTCLSCGDSKCS